MAKFRSGNNNQEETYSNPGLLITGSLAAVFGGLIYSIIFRLLMIYG